MRFVSMYLDTARQQRLGGSNSILIPPGSTLTTKAFSVCRPRLGSKHWHEIKLGNHEIFGRFLTEIFCTGLAKGQWPSAHMKWALFGWDQSLNVCFLSQLCQDWMQSMPHKQKFSTLSHQVGVGCFGGWNLKLTLFIPFPVFE